MPRHDWAAKALHAAPAGAAMRRLGLLCGMSALMLAAAGFAAETKAQSVLVPAQSELTFVFRQMGVPVEGRFRRFDARVALDPARPDGGSVLLTIDTASASLGAPEIDAELPKPEWLAAGKFPSASFESTRIRALDATRYEVLGKVTIKGTVRELAVPVSLSASAGLTTASGTATFKRRDYRIGEGSWSDPSVVADEVQVKFRLVLRGSAAGGAKPP